MAPIRLLTPSTDTVTLQLTAALCPFLPLHSIVFALATDRHAFTVQFFTVSPEDAAPLLEKVQAFAYFEESYSPTSKSPV
jgi:hypothetical protein